MQPLCYTQRWAVRMRQLLLIVVRVYLFVTLCRYALQGDQSIFQLNCLL